MEKKNIKDEVYPIEVIEDIREIASKGYDVILNTPSHYYGVEFYYDRVCLLSRGFEIDYEDTEFKSDDDEEVYDWLNNLNNEYELTKAK